MRPFCVPRLLLVPLQAVNFYATGERHLGLHYTCG
jgi:hypothetical protein